MTNGNIKRSPSHHGQLRCRACSLYVDIVPIWTWVIAFESPESGRYYGRRYKAATHKAPRIGVEPWTVCVGSGWTI